MIRAFKESDAEPVIEIYNMCGDVFDKSIDCEFINEFLNIPDFKMVVAVFDDEVAGFAGVFLYGFGISEFGPVAVKPGFRNQGVGTDLLEHLLEFLKSKNIEAVITHVKSVNVCALNFFARSGFEIETKFNNFMQEEITQMVKVV